MSRVWRELTHNERQLIELLLTKDFPDVEALRNQLETAKASAIDAEGSLQFRVSGPLATVQQRVPTEGDATLIRKMWNFVLRSMSFCTSWRASSMSWKSLKMTAQQL